MSDAVIVSVVPEIQLSDIKIKQNEEATETAKITIPTEDSEQNEDCNKTDDLERSKDSTVCLNILDMQDVDKCADNEVSKDYLVYNYFNGAQKQKYSASVWVQQMGGGGYDEGGGLDYDPESRNSFLLVVFIIVFIMLAITATFVILVFQIEALSEFFTTYGLYLVIPAAVVMIALSYGISCSACCRMFPCNIIVLILTVVAMSILAAFVTNHYRTEIVFYALLATGGTVLVCLALACSSYDFTSWTLYVVVIAAAFSVIALIIGVTMLATGTYLKGLHLVILIVGTIINVVMLVIELQMILGGKSIEISDNDYALAAFLLYTTIIELFLKMVRIFGILDSYL